MKQERSRVNSFERFASVITRLAGSTFAFIGSGVLIFLWLVTGPFFHYSQGWQLFINTTTTVITFLMVFAIQKAQNKDAMAIQLKLNELVAAHEMASNRLVSVEDMTEEELKALRKFYSRLAVMSKQSENIQESHSVEEAEELHEEKLQERVKKEQQRQ